MLRRRGTPGHVQDRVYPSVRHGEDAGLYKEFPRDERARSRLEKRCVREGTGYSCLSYLGRFPVDYIKIACSFVGGLGENSLATLLVKGVIDLTQNLVLGVTAKGAGTESQLEQPRGMGCDLAQDFISQSHSQAAQPKNGPRPSAFHRTPRGGKHS